MDVLLTGSTGFIGKYLHNKYNFRHVVRYGSAHSLNNVFKISSLDKNTNWENAFDGIKHVIHLAGLAHSNQYTEKDYINVNYEGTIKLASDAAKAGVKRFIFISSIGVNGSFTKEEPFSPNSIPMPHSPYARSKYYAEVGLNNIAKTTKMEVVIIRPTLVYGPHAPGNFDALVRFINKSPILPFKMFKNKRSFISVQNLVDLIITCLEHPDAAGKILLPSDGFTISIKDFTSAIADGLGKNKLQIPIPKALFQLAGKLFMKSRSIEQLACNLEIDSKFLSQELGWQPPYSMEECMISLKDKYN